MTVRICKTRHGTMMVEDHDEYVGRSLIELGEFGEPQIDLFRSIVTRDMVVVDAGANVGALTVALARMARYVHAFEPQRHVYHMLCGNVALNGLLNVSCYHMALGAKDEMLSIPMLALDRVNNLGSFNVEMAGEAADRVRLAPLIIPCNFLKIDVEGYEREVLLGAEPMIRDCRPVIYVENDRPEKADALIEQLRSMGYTPYWHITPMFSPENFRGVKEDIFGSCHSFDMLCTPGVAVDGGTEAHAGDLARMMAPKEVEHAAA